MKQKNELATLSREQSNPYLALPEDFEILRDSDSVFHAQRSDAIQKQSDAECNRKPNKRSVATESSDAGRPKTPSGRDEE